jgi:site-specific DNA recombinase
MVGIYARVSTEEQAKSGFSLQDQIRECRKKAGTNEVIEYVDEGITGEFLDRPALIRLRQDVKNGIIERIICLDPDRLSRKLMNQLIVSEELEKRASLEFVNGEYQQTPEGKLFYQMRGAISEFEKAKITERFSRGRKEKARQGRVVRDYKVFGYTYNKELGQFEIDPYEAEIVRMIFKLFTDKLKNVQGINGIANYLTQLGIPTKRGAEVWHRQVVRQILMNQAYIGEFYQNRWNTEGMMGNKFRDSVDKIPMRVRPATDWIVVQCPTIIDKDTFYYAQQLLNESRQRWSGTSKNEYLLSGLVRCGICGNTMTGRKSKNWGKYVYEYTDLKNTAGAKNPGCGIKMKAEDIDGYVWDTVQSWLNDVKDFQGFDYEESQALSLEEAEVKRLQKTLEEKELGRKSFLKRLVDGKPLGIDESDINELLIFSKKEIEEIKSKIEQLSYEIESNKSKKFSRYLVEEAAQYFLDFNPEEMGLKDKKELIRYIVKEIWVYKDEIKVFGF